MSAHVAERQLCAMNVRRPDIPYHVRVVSWFVHPAGSEIEWFRFRCGDSTTRWHGLCCGNGGFDVEIFAAVTAFR